MRRSRLHDVYRLLYEAYGRQSWWPADGPFEVMVGAILTQNTAWTNVERALGNLKSSGWLEPARLCAGAADELARLIRPSGSFNLKAARLQNFCRWYLAGGGFHSLRRLHTATLRRRLLALSGIGPETADAILLYAFERPVFVVDAYTRRILGRFGFRQARADYESLRTSLEADLPRRVRLYQEFHALLVAHAKQVCRTRPRCAQCCLLAGCAGALR